MSQRLLCHWIGRQSVECASIVLFCRLSLVDCDLSAALMCLSLNPRSYLMISCSLCYSPFISISPTGGHTVDRFLVTVSSSRCANCLMATTSGDWCVSAATSVDWLGLKCATVFFKPLTLIDGWFNATNSNTNWSHNIEMSPSYWIRTAATRKSNSGNDVLGGFYSPAAETCSKIQECLGMRISPFP